MSNRFTEGEHQQRRRDREEKDKEKHKERIAIHLLVEREIEFGPRSWYCSSRRNQCLLGVTLSCIQMALSDNRDTNGINPTRLRPSRLRLSFRLTMTLSD